MNTNNDFVLFRLPDEKQINFAELSSQNNSEYIFKFHSFDNQLNYIFYLNRLIKFNYVEFALSNFDIKLEPCEHSPRENKQDYLFKCNKFIQALQQGQFDKLILSRIAVRDKFQNLKSAFLNLCEKYPSAFIYLIRFNNETWMGASPERLISSDGKELKTVALAGTKAVSENREWTEKEHREHELVVDYIASVFEDSQVKTGQTVTVQLHEIQHLKTPISVKLNAGFDLDNILHKLHPTPAVCGIPKTKAMQYILDHEGYDRNFYTGYFGLISPEKSEIFVNLRCAKLFADETHVYVGGGLLSESDPEKEWEETVWKAKALF